MSDIRLAAARHAPIKVSRLQLKFALASICLLPIAGPSLAATTTSPPGGVWRRALESRL